MRSLHTAPSGPRAFALGLFGFFVGCAAQDGPANPPKDAAAADAVDVAAPPDAPPPDAAAGDAAEERADVASTDAPDSADALDAADAPDAADAADGPEAAACDALPAGPLTATRLFDGLSGALDLTFDRRGNAVLAAGAVVAVDAMGARTTRVAGGAGAAYQLRFATTGDLLLGNAANVQRVSTAGAVEFAALGVEAYGLAVDDADRFWFVNYSAGTVSRSTLVGASSAVIRDVPRPIYLAFGATPDTLFVGSGTGAGPAALYRVRLRAEPGGAVTADPAQRVASLDRGVTGLAVDVCGNVYVAQADAGQLVRVAPDTGAVTALVTGLVGIRGGAFGAGAGFDDRALYVVNERASAVYSIPVGVRGVALAAPRP
jgi:hypothetical protein